MTMPFEKFRCYLSGLRGKHAGLALLLLLATLGGYAIALSRSQSSSPQSSPVHSFGYLQSSRMTNRAGAVQATSGIYPGVSLQSAPGSSPNLSSAIIRTADMTIRVAPKKTQTASDRARAVASSLGGYVLSSTFNRQSYEVNLVLRVPSQNFNKALSGLRRLGVVTAEDIRGEDVSLQFVDLGARLKNLEAQREELLKLFSRANTVQDTIRVQQVLGDVQYQVEQTQARLRYLSNRTDLATITLALQSKHHVVPPSHPGRIGKAFSQAIVASLTVVAGSIVFVGYLLPFALVALAGYGVYLLSRRRGASRKAARPAEPQSS
jgi:hypothetical protein